MGEVVPFPWLGDRTTDGGKARIKARRRILFQQEPVNDLVMMQPDPEMPCDSNPYPSNLA